MPGGDAWAHSCFSRCEEVQGGFLHIRFMRWTAGRRPPVDNRDRGVASRDGGWSVLGVFYALSAPVKKWGFWFEGGERVPSLGTPAAALGPYLVNHGAFHFLVVRAKALEGGCGAKVNGIRSSSQLRSGRGRLRVGFISGSQQGRRWRKDQIRGRCRWDSMRR